MPQPKVSVIVPVYKVAKYLPQCLDPLVAKTLQDLGILLINDGSTDGSTEILRAYAARDPRFRLIDRVNGGYSAARKTGLSAARGKCVGSVDKECYIWPLSHIPWRPSHLEKPSTEIPDFSFTTLGPF